MENYNKSVNTSLESYESPAVEVIEVEVEKGFAQSFGGEQGGWE